MPLLAGLLGLCVLGLLTNSVRADEVQVKIRSLGQTLQEVTFTAPSNSSRVVTIRATLDTAAGFFGDTTNGAVSLTAAYKGVLTTWQIDDTSATGNRSLCFNISSLPLASSVSTVKKKETVAFALFSTYERDVSVRIDSGEEDLLLGLEETRRISLGPNSPRVLQFSPPARTYGFVEDETYLVSLESVHAKDICMYVAINPPGCPWHADVASIRNSRMWARMLAVGYFPVNPVKFPKGFTITLLPLEDNSGCFTGQAPKVNSTVKVVDVRVDRTPGHYGAPIAVSVVLVFVFAGLFLCVWIGLWYCNKKNHVETTGVNGELENCQELCMDRAASPPILPSTAYRDVLRLEILKKNEGRGSHKSQHCLQAVNRLKKDKLCLMDMTQNMQNPWHRRQRSKTYLLLVPLLAVFYIVPSAQMVYAEFLRSKESGNMERCYLNYGCSRPYGTLDDFNHVISNLGYFIYGLMFIAMVFIKSKLLPEGHKTHEDHLSSTGPLQQHSLFFTMGFCMIAQGSFSVIFHLCPSNISLQFDTTMMYIMMILVFIKIFQLRHPDTAYNAFHTMYVFGIALVFEAASLYAFNTAVRFVLYAAFALLYLLLMIHMAVDIYYYGAIKTNYTMMMPVFVGHSVKYCGEVLYKRKFILTSLFIILNIAILSTVLVITYKEPGRSLSTPMLASCGLNVGCYLFYYFAKKIGEVCQVCQDPPDLPMEEQEEPSGRRISKVFMRLVSFVFFGLAVAFGMTAAFFYGQRHQSRNSTPPESRNLNEACNWMDFFDNHDMWHFFSSTALFLAFIGLLTIDDDLLYVPRDKIPVF